MVHFVQKANALKNTVKKELVKIDNDSDQKGILTGYVIKDKFF